MLGCKLTIEVANETRFWVSHKKKDSKRLVHWPTGYPSLKEAQSFASTLTNLDPEIEFTDVTPSPTNPHSKPFTTYKPNQKLKSKVKVEVTEGVPF